MVQQRLRIQGGDRTPSRRTFRRTAIVTFLLLLAEIVTASSGVFSLSASLALDKVWEILATCAALGAWIRSALRHPGAQGRWRWWMAAAMAVFLVGLLAWSYGQVIGATPLPTQTLGPAGFLLTPMLALVAVILHAYGRTEEPSPLGAGSNRAVRVLDVAIIASALLLFVIVTLGDELSSDWQVSGPILTLLAAHPLAYLLLVAGVVVLARIRSAARDLPLLFIGLAGAAYVGSSTLFAHIVELGLDTVPPWLEAGFMACPVLFFLAALAPSSPPRPPEPSIRPTAWEVAQLAVPYLPLIGTTLFIASGLAGGLTLSREQEIALLVLLGLVIGRQITTLVENNRLLRRAEHGALHDALTGLANRTLFLHRLERSLRWRTPVAVAFCDMDDFKEVNDTFGHAAGDLVLRTTARRLERCVQPGDTVARLGGDEFAVLLRNPRGKLEESGRGMLEVLQEPHLICGVRRVVSASVGITWLTADSSAASTDELLSHADAAMYMAKRRGKNTLAHIPEHEEEPAR